MPRVSTPHPIFLSFLFALFFFLLILPRSYWFASMCFHSQPFFLTFFSMPFWYAVWLQSHSNLIHVVLPLSYFFFVVCALSWSDYLLGNRRRLSSVGFNTTRDRTFRKADIHLVLGFLCLTFISNVHCLRWRTSNCLHRNVEHSMTYPLPCARPSVLLLHSFFFLVPFMSLFMCNTRLTTLLDITTHCQTLSNHENKANASFEAHHFFLFHSCCRFTSFFFFS